MPLLSFTPQATAGAWAGALLIRGRGARITAALAGAALTAAIASRALPRRQPPASGPVLRLLTANLREGRAAAAPLVALARRTGADVLFVQELTDDAVTRLQRAGLSALLPHHITQTVAVGAAEHAPPVAIAWCCPRDGLKEGGAVPSTPGEREGRTTCAALCWVVTVARARYIVSA